MDKQRPHLIIAALFALFTLAACGGFEERERVVTLVAKDVMPFNVGGMAVGPYEVWLAREHKRNVTLVAHELCHALQWQRHGADFLIMYKLQVAAYGYWNAPLEVECLEMQYDVAHRRWARGLIEYHFR